MPPEVAIDEAVTLAKRYASEDAGRLVNGILGRVARRKQLIVRAMSHGSRSGRSRRARAAQARLTLRSRGTPCRSMPEDEMSAEDSLQGEELLKRLEATRAKLEATEDPQEAVDVLAELAEIAKEVAGCRSSRRSGRRRVRST